MTWPPSDPKNNKCINSIRQYILSVFDSVCQNVKFQANNTILFRKTPLKAHMTIFFRNLGGMAPLPPLGSFCLCFGPPLKIFYVHH